MKRKPAPPVPISSCMRTTWPMNSLLWAAPLPVSSFSMALASQRMPRTPMIGSGASSMMRVVFLMAAGRTCAQSGVCGVPTG